MDPTDMMVMNLTSFKVALVLHILGAMILFAAVGLQALTTLLLRRAGSTAQIKIIHRIVRRLPPIFGLATLLILASGSFMGYLDWSHDETIGWTIAATILFLVIAISGALIGRRVEKGLGRALQTSGSQMTKQLTQAARNQLTLLQLGAGSCSIIGILIVMIFQPGTLTASIILVVALVVGLGGAAMFSDKSTT
jgi:uncharacterized membrane protein